MARPRNRRPDPLDLAGPIVGMLFILSLISPQVRALIMVLPMLLIFGAIVAVVGTIIWLIIRALSKPLVEDPPHQSQSPKDLSLFLEKAISDRTKQPIQTPPPQITADLLADLEWRRFEILITAYFQKTGYRAWRNRVGADGGVDILLAWPGEQQPCACVQCKAWKTYTVGVKPVRELFGVMAGDRIPEGYMVTTGEYTSEARDFAQGKPLTLISGRQLLDRLKQLPEADHASILREITSGDYTTPTCPRCDVKMVERQGPKNLFWGCRNYPRCRQTFNIREEDAQRAGSYAAG
jgi:restriction system protein